MSGIYLVGAEVAPGWTGGTVAAAGQLAARFALSFVGVPGLLRCRGRGWWPWFAIVFTGRMPGSLGDLSDGDRSLPVAGALIPVRPH